MRTRLGTNQYQVKHQGLKRGTKLTIGYISLLVGIVCYMGYTNRESGMHFESAIPMNTAYAYTVEVGQAPELAPLGERENSIRVIKKIWGKDWRVGVAIATCESGLRAEAFNGKNTNGTWDAGLFQVNTIHGWSKEELFNPVANAGIAYSKYVEQGPNPWYSSKKCWEEKL